MQLIERVLQFSDILASSKTSSVGQWNLEYLKNVIQRAIDLEKEISIASEEEVKLVYQKFVSKASNGQTRTPDFKEFKSTFYLLYGTLLKNVYLPSDLVSFLIEAYSFPHDLTSVKDNISEVSFPELNLFILRLIFFFLFFFSLKIYIYIGYTSFY